MTPPLIDPDRLRTVSNYADAFPSKRGVRKVSVGYVYQLIAAGKVEVTKIDGVTFIVLPAGE